MLCFEILQVASDIYLAADGHVQVYFYISDQYYSNSRSNQIPLPIEVSPGRI